MLQFFVAPVSEFSRISIPGIGTVQKKYRKYGLVHMLLEAKVDFFEYTAFRLIIIPGGKEAEEMLSHNNKECRESLPKRCQICSR